MGRGDREQYFPIDERDQSTVRALILARTSDPGGSDEQVESQVQQCDKFLRAMGWHHLHPDNLYAYAEKATGMRLVKRPVLSKVLRMAAQGEVDVIVCLSIARIDRRKPRRWQAVQTALDYGVEFRFVQFKDERGKMPKGLAGALQEFTDDVYDEKEAEKIAERLGPAKLLRYEMGLPHGGRNGPLYGYADGIRKVKPSRSTRPGKPMGLLTWVLDEPKAEHIRWLFKVVDERPLADVSLRGLAREMETVRQAPTATGTGHWSAKQIYNLLRNGKYAGVGRGLRYEVKWGSYTNKATRERFDTPHVRARDAAETLPVSAEAIPPIITDIEQWERVQVKLELLKAQHNRGGPRRGDAEANSARLDGFAFCAHCGNKLVHYWHSRDKHLYYQCGTSAGTPESRCKAHHARAAAVESAAFAILGDALTNSEKIANLADAAQDIYMGYVTDAELAASATAAHRKRLAEIATQRHVAVDAIRMLGAVVGMEAHVAGLRATVEQLDRDKADAEKEIEQTEPMHQRADARVVLLDKLRHGGLLLYDFDIMKGQRVSVDFLSRDDLADMLGKPMARIEYNARLVAAGLPEVNPVTAMRLAQDELEAKGEWWIPMAEVAAQLLQRMPVDELHTMLRDLDVKVLLSRPRTRAEWATLGRTPVADRVSVQLAGVVLVRADAANVNRFS